jgi:hypothetical protein
MSRPTTRDVSTEPRLGFFARVFLSFAVSFLVGLPVLFLGADLGFISSGDEGRWQPYTATAGLLWSTLVFAFAYPAARERWGRGNGIAASSLAAIGATIVVFLATIVWLFVFLIAVGYESS